MDFNLINVGIVLFRAVIVFLIMWPRNNSFHRNIGAGVTVTVLIICFVIIVICLLLAGNTIIRNGVGELTTDYAEFIEPLKGSGEGDFVIITVNLDTIYIGEKKCSDIYEAKQEIANAVAAGKRLRIIDDYATAVTYNGLIDAILDMNVSRSSIEEIKQP